MNTVKKTACMLLATLCLTACNEQVKNAEVIDVSPEIIPDYVGVTVPESIAPLNFTFPGSFERINAVIEGREGGRIETQGKAGVQIPVKQWQQLLAANKGGELRVTVAVKQDGNWKEYAPFPIYISEYPIDHGLAYRLIAPGYEVYSKMGIYQRSLCDFNESAIYENTLVPGSCVNCHSFKQTAPGSMSLHIRGEYGGTLLFQDDDFDMLDLKTPSTISSGVYPYWHPSGKYIAYSVNRTQQAFHAKRDERVEVVDLESDVIVYDIEANKVLSSPLLKTDAFETFPSFSPDGRTLYFCCSEQKRIPEEYDQIRYNLCKIDFDPATGTFGNRIDTLVHAEAIGKSVAVPRPSYDGKYVMYTLSDYGNFLIWHKDADLWLLDLATGETNPLVEANSPDSDSYHSWSSNSRWFVFSSRRDDGLYTRLYLSSIDDNGRATKPFRLPQEKVMETDPSFYSFNVPEFISGPVKIDLPKVEKKIVSKERKQAL